MERTKLAKKIVRDVLAMARGTLVVDKNAFVLNILPVP